ncbi:Estradiol 17-beta-dehydrogenase 8 [Chionoecetes opilio]|uniref:Estradiol 17-beta-dehydrogenase 8 n=1 Tax=Chionoecetes opilio TaxID=41210 RepID=A0A8J4YQJ0_CHIOP|nr:Estradiol 17-beta-dehydrogenase 8 [Chionoecetes opilio]
MALDTFKGQVALVTGGGGGIGRAICLQLARDGARVVVTDLNLESARETLRLMSGKICPALSQPSEPPGAVHGRDATQRHRGLIAAARDRFGAPPSLLVNCAGIADFGNFQDITKARLDKMMDVNLKGTFIVSQAVIRALLEGTQEGGEGRGAVVNISSIQGKTGFLAHSHYAAAKGGMIAFTKSCAAEMANLINTAINNSVDKEVLEAYINKTPLGRPGTPEGTTNGHHQRDHHQRGSTNEAPPTREHQRGSTNEASPTRGTNEAAPTRHHQRDITNEAAPTRHHQRGSTNEAAPTRHHQRGTTKDSGNEATLKRHHQRGSTTRHHQRGITNEGAPTRQTPKEAAPTRHHQRGITHEASPTRHHQRGTTNEASPTRHHQRGAPTRQHHEAVPRGSTPKRQHQRGTTNEAPPTRHHQRGSTQRGSTNEAAPTRQHQRGITNEAPPTRHHPKETPPTRHHQRGTTKEASPTRHHQRGTTNEAPPTRPSTNDVGIIGTYVYPYMYISCKAPFAANHFLMFEDYFYDVSPPLPRYDHTLTSPHPGGHRSECLALPRPASLWGK